MGGQAGRQLYAIRTPDHTNQASPLRQTSKTIEMNPGQADKQKATERLARPTLATQAGVKTIEVKLVVSRGSLALPPGQADQKTTELTARPTLATQAGRQLYAMHFYGFARLGIWRTIWDGLGM